jgi:hypothetical protein
MPWQSVGTVRVSCAAILRIRSDDWYVLLRAPSRPETFGPPGGVFKYFPPAERILEELGFRADRIAELPDDMRHDLRGFVPAGAIGEFRRWFAGGAYREDTARCLSRELGEELAECGLDDLVPLTRRLTFSVVRTLWEGPREVPGLPYRQLRWFEVCDVTPSDPAAQRLRGELISAGQDDRVPLVICATSADLQYGRRGIALIAGHAPHLIGARRSNPDIPAIR